MPLPSNPNSVRHAFFQPLAGLVEASSNTRPCPEFPDQSWLELGLQRVLEPVPSGRAFLQEHGPRFPDPPGRSNYFYALHSARRGGLAREVNLALLAQAVLPDRLADLPELKTYECFALDGHWHQAAAHDPRHAGVKMAVGHFYSLDLRGHQLRHLAVGEGWHEHDMSVLQRLKPSGLRQGVPRGRRVLLIYDKAGIDFHYWQRCRQERAIYFISRVKQGMVYDWLASRPVESKDRRNLGVTEDRLILTTAGQRMRMVYYTEPGTGEPYTFLTNEPDLPPGVIVELYRRRWEIEKVFDEIKNKLGEKKAWGSSLTAKAAQGQLVALAHNLLLLYEDRLARQRGVTNQAEDRRRQRRSAGLTRAARQAGRAISTLLLSARQTTQRSVKFVRWLRHALRENLAEEAAVPRLITLYATL